MPRSSPAQCYDHVQRAPLHLLLLALALGEGTAALLVHDPLVRAALGAAAIAVAVIACSFRYLRVRDAGDHLEVRFGPLPIFVKRIDYRELRSVEPARSGWIDGWGIHYTLGRGWIYNLWGRDCVRLEREKGALRIGTDDVEGLTRFLRERIADRRR